MIPRRIAIVFEYRTLNGGERSMLAAIDWLRDTRCDLEFVAIGSPAGRLAKALEERRIRLIGWSPYDDTGRRLAAAEIEASLRSAIESTLPNLVHANSLAMGRLLGRVSHHLRIPTTAHLRDIIRLSATAVADINRNRGLIAVSEATKAFHVQQGIDADRMIVVRNGIDLDTFQPRTPTGWLHNELGLIRGEGDDRHRPRHQACSEISVQENKFPCGQSPVKLIACIGQIGMRKGQDVLASAADEITKRVPGAHFLLIGERTSQKAESIDFEQNVDARFAAAGLSDRLHRLGHRDDVAEILSEIDLLVHPANQEPYGRVLLEASAMGVPIVATRVGGTTEIIDESVTGLIVRPQDPEALASAVCTILSDYELSTRFRTNARRKAVNEFSIETAAQKLVEVWNNVGSPDMPEAR